MRDERLAGFFERHSGRRLDVADNQPIERGMSVQHLREELARYRTMLETGIRSGGSPITERERAEIALQARRFEVELTQRPTND